MGLPVEILEVHQTFSIHSSVESTDNGVFDCRVLSRRHASLWTEGSRCFVRDLGSSNGTFVNGERVDRLQSEGVELFSGDYLQFGEDVDDNYCVRATVRLLPEESAEGEGENQTETPMITISGMQLNDHSYFFSCHFHFFVLSTSSKERTILKSTSEKPTRSKQLWE